MYGKGKKTLLLSQKILLENVIISLTILLQSITQYVQLVEKIGLNGKVYLDELKKDEIYGNLYIKDDRFCFYIDICR